MKATSPRPLEPAAPPAQALQMEWVERLTRAIQTDGTVDPLEGLRLCRASSPRELGHGVAHPSFCVLAQGSKEVLLGENRIKQLRETVTEGAAEF